MSQKTEGSKKIVRDGVTLELIARKQWEGEWELIILNEYGVSSVWHDLFASCGEALAAGENAIDEEGTEQFTDMEGFEYLLEDKTVRSLH